jgi:outer membrane receptor protein involved in Fe transport
MGRQTFRGIRFAFFAAILPTGFATSVPAFAEEAKAAIEEIVVTAQKREENVQDVPVAITAVSAKELAQPAIRTLVDLNGYAPNVNIARDPSRAGGAALTIRGISPTRTDDNSLDSPIAVMTDGIYLGTLSGQIIENFDLERVEILRGPQGTLFGKNTIGGVVSVIRSRPTGEWGGRFKVDYGDWNDREFRGVVNAPVIEDKLAAKGFYTIMKNDGFLTHSGTGNNMPEKDYENYGLTLLATPVDKFEALFTVEKYKDNSQGGGSLTNYNLAGGVAAPPSDPRQTDLSGGFLSCTLFATHIIPQWDSTVPCRNNLKTAKNTTVDTPNPSSFDVNADTLNMNYELSDHLKLVSVTGYRDMQENRKLDFDGSSGPFITIDRNNNYDQTSEELRLEGTWDKLAVVAGAYYWDSKFTQDWLTGAGFWKYVGSLSGYDLSDNTWINPVFGGLYIPNWNPATDPFYIANPFIAPPNGTGLIGVSPLEACWQTPSIAAIPEASRTAEQSAILGLFGNVRCDTGATLAGLGPNYVQKLYETQKTTSYAYFIQADWEFVENWTLTVGTRYTDEQKNFKAGQAYLAPVAREGISNFPAYAKLDNDWTKWTPKVGVSYKFTPDILFYTSYSEGFHSGGFFGVNQNVADFTRDQYKPEKVESSEAGMKSQFFDNTVQLNLAYFYNKYKNKQEQSVQLDPTTNTVATVFSNVATATYQGAEVETQWVATDHINLFATMGYLDAKYDSFKTDVNPNDKIDNIVDASFLTPRNAPKYTYGAGATVTYPVGPGNLQVFGKYSWIDKIQTDLLNLKVGELDARKDLSASIGYFYKNMSLVLYGNNLTDETFEIPFLIYPLFASGTVNPGRSWGLSFSIDI